MRLTVTTFLSLDGVYQSPGAPDEDGTGYEYGGWTAPVRRRGLRQVHDRRLRQRRRVPARPQDL